MDENQTLELYKIVKGDHVSWLNLHREHAEHYLTFIAAVFAVTLGGVYQFKDNPWLSLAIVIGPVVNVLLCANAAQICDRFYQQFLEAITIEAKLEALLGFTNPRPSVPSKSPMPFSQDQYILPERWLKSRQPYATAAEFVEANMDSGANRLVRRVFRVLLVANIGFAVAIVVISISIFSKLI